MTVRILLDATAIPRDRGGVGRYLDGLVSAFEGAEVHIACQERDAATFSALAPQAGIHAQPTAIASAWRRLIWEQLTLPRLAARIRADVIHSPHYTLPLVTRRARVVTMHDATFFSDPRVHTPLKRSFFRAWIRISARLADAVVVPSRATADELRRYVEIRGAVVVAPHGVDQSVFHPPTKSEVAAFAERHGLSTWIAFLGTLEPRKNLVALLDAHRMLDAAERPPLALAGARGWDDELDRRLDGADPPTELGYLPLDDLRAFLGGAVIVAYPSLGEGFGLPVLEAMATGATVLTTRRLAIPEVGGDAVAYSEPDATSLGASLRDLLAEPERRAALSAAALIRSSEFTWQRTWEAHLAAYESASEVRS